MNHAGRIARVGESLAGAQADALLVTDLTNVRYLTGFSGTNAQLLVWPTGALFLSDPRYEARAKDLVSEVEIDIYPVQLSDLLGGHLARTSVKRLGIEASSVTLATRDRLAKKLTHVELVHTQDLVEDLRRTKDAEEVALIRQAAELADDAFMWILDRLAPGVSEREIALDLEVRMRLSGAEGVSFEPIVGSGPLAAHIHHTPSERVLEKGDLVLLDLGARVDGYCSDLTRTVALGSVDNPDAELYGTVLAAQLAGIGAIKEGVEGAYADRVARHLIDDAGHGDSFGHGLGHGVGLDIHEAPTLKKTSEDTLRAGDVVTVEPGIYLPGRGGIRIEDCVLVTAAGCDVLTTAMKDELIQL